MLLGETCTRACSFCDVNTGKPGEVDWRAERGGRAVASTGPQHAVLTSVNRDDLDDGGRDLRPDHPRDPRAVAGVRCEVLIPDFKGDRDALEIVMAAKPEFSTTTPRRCCACRRDIRTGANYGRSLRCWLGRSGHTRRYGEVGTDRRDGGDRARDRRSAGRPQAVGVDVVTIGQYLRPTATIARCDRYVEPARFDDYKPQARHMACPTSSPVRWCGARTTPRSPWRLRYERVGASRMERARVRSCKAAGVDAHCACRSGPTFPYLTGLPGDAARTSDDAGGAEPTENAVLVVPASGGSEGRHVRRRVRE